MRELNVPLPFGCLHSDAQGQHFPPLESVAPSRLTNPRQATTPVAVLLAGWSLGVSTPNLKVFLNVSIIVIGVVIASIGEIKFVWIGVIYQIAGVICEALRLTMVQRLLSSADFKMDPLVSLYYFAPICAVMNFVVAAAWEIPRCTLDDIYNVGLLTFFLNGLCAFLLNVSVVFLVSDYPHVSEIASTNHVNRLARLPPLFLLCAVFLKTSCSLSPP